MTRKTAHTKFGLTSGSRQLRTKASQKSQRELIAHLISIGFALALAVAAAAFKLGMALEYAI